MVSNEAGRERIVSETRKILSEMVEGNKRYPGIHRLIKNDDDDHAMHGLRAMADIMIAAAKIVRSDVTEPIIHNVCAQVILAYQESLKVNDPDGTGPLPDPKQAAEKWGNLAEKTEKLADDVVRAHTELYHGNLLIEDHESKQLKRIAEKLRARAGTLKGIQTRGRKFMREYGYLGVDRSKRKDAPARVFWRHFCTQFLGDVRGPTGLKLGHCTKQVAELASVIFEMPNLDKKVVDADLINLSRREAPE